MARAKILKTHRETPFCQYLEILPDNDSVSESYKIPGQYSTLRFSDGQEGSFAMCNPPGEKTWSFLIKKSGGERVTTGVLEISRAQGNGFQMDRAPGKNILLLAVGSAIAPIRAVLLELLKNRSDYKTMTLYYGAIDPGEFAYQGEFGKWKNRGVEIIQTLFPPNPSWKGLTGFVQNHLPKKISKNTAAFICGMDEMVTQSRFALIQRGVPADDILTNV